MGPTQHGVEPLDAAADYEDEEDPDRTVEVEEIEAQRAQIEVTRAEMSDTIEAIKEKLSPDRLVEQAKETIHDATIGRAQEAVSNVMDTARDKVSQVKETVYEVGDRARETGSDFMDLVRENPVPAAMIGIGLGWLVMNARKNAGRERRYREYRRAFDRDYGYVPAPYQPAYGFQPSYNPQGTYGYATGSRESYPMSQPGQAAAPFRAEAGAGYQAGTVRSEADGPGFVEQTRERVGGAAGEVRDRAEEVIERFRDQAGNVVERVRDQAGNVFERVRETAGDFAERTRYGATQARYAAREGFERISEGFDRTLDQNPLALGVAAMAVGAAVGLMLPETRYEHRVMGEARDRVVDTVQQKAQDLGQRVQSVAREVVDTAKETVTQQAQAQGLTGQPQGQGQAMGQTQGTPPGAMASAGTPLETVNDKAADTTPAWSEDADVETDTNVTSGSSRSAA